MKRIFIALLWIMLPAFVVQAQEIDFGDYGNYSITVDELNSDPLDFGQVITGSGTHAIDLNNAKVITITGVKYLDVFIDVMADEYLYLNGSQTTDDQKRINFTLEAAFANNAGQPNIGKAKIINVPSNNFTKQLPILARQNLPPGPPPPPPTEEFNQAEVEDTAHLYLYGTIDVGNVDAGSYEAQITVNISYD